MAVVVLAFAAYVHRRQQLYAHKAQNLLETFLFVCDLALVAVAVANAIFHDAAGEAAPTWAVATFESAVFTLVLGSLAAAFIVRHPRPAGYRRAHRGLRGSSSSVKVLRSAAK
eukprot:3243415-Prymnesium_polylepis.2